MTDPDPAALLRARLHAALATGQTGGHLIAAVADPYAPMIRVADRVLAEHAWEPLLDTDTAADSRLVVALERVVMWAGTVAGIAGPAGHSPMLDELCQLLAPVALAEPWFHPDDPDTRTQPTRGQQAGPEAEGAR